MEALLWVALLAGGGLLWVMAPLLSDRDVPAVEVPFHLRRAKERARAALLALHDLAEDHRVGRIEGLAHRRLERRLAVEALGALRAEEAARCIAAGEDSESEAP